MRPLRDVKWPTVFGARSVPAMRAGLGSSHSPVPVLPPIILQMEGV